MSDYRHCCICATPRPSPSGSRLSRRTFLAAGMAAAMCPAGGTGAESTPPIQLPRPVLYDGSASAFLAWGRSSFVDDLIASPSYGGMETFTLRSSGEGATAVQPEERKAQARLEGKAAKIIANGGEAIPRLLRLVFEEHIRHKTGPASAPIESADDALLNLASRATACGDVATALSLLLNRAGIRTRILMLAREADGLGRADHVTLEAYSPQAGRWLLLEGLLGVGPTKGAVSRHPTLGFLDLAADPAARTAMNDAHGQNYYTERTGFAAILPDPDYSHPVEVFWVPTHEAASRFMSLRFGLESMK